MFGEVSEARGQRRQQLLDAWQDKCLQHPALCNRETLRALEQVSTCDCYLPRKVLERTVQAAKDAQDETLEQVYLYTDWILTPGLLLHTAVRTNYRLLRKDASFHSLTRRRDYA